MFFTLLQDPHFSDAPPASRKDDFLAACLAKFEQIIVAQQDFACLATVIAGDIFHVPRATNVSHALVNTVTQVFRRLAGDKLLVAGNHDLPFCRVDLLHKQPLGNLLVSGTAHLLDKSPKVYEEGGVSIEICGTSYTTQDVRDWLEALPPKTTTYRMVVLHAGIAPSSGSPFWREGFLAYQDICGYDFDIALLGHLHLYFPTQVVNGKIFISPGGIMRGSIHEDELIRIPRFAILRIDNRPPKVIEVELRCQPSSEVFDIEKHKEMKDEAAAIEQFVSELAVQAALAPVDDVMATLQSIDVPQRVREFAIVYLTNAGLEVEDGRRNQLDSVARTREV